MSYNLSENEILKLHTILEIFVLNPIFKKNFELGKTLFANFWYFMLYEMAEGLITFDKNKFLKVSQRDPYQNGWRRLIFKWDPQFFSSCYVGPIEPYKTVKAVFQNCKAFSRYERETLY